VILLFKDGSGLMRRRFVSPDIKKKYDLELPEYEGIDQIVEVGSSGEKL
jgi:NAD(P)H-hydrate epimerase